MANGPARRRTSRTALRRGRATPRGSRRSASRRQGLAMATRWLGEAERLVAALELPRDVEDVSPRGKGGSHARPGAREGNAVVERRREAADGAEPAGAKLRARQRRDGVRARPSGSPRPGNGRATSRTSACGTETALRCQGLASAAPGRRATPRGRRRRWVRRGEARSAPAAR